MEIVSSNGRARLSFQPCPEGFAAVMASPGLIVALRMSRQEAGGLIDWIRAHMPAEALRSPPAGDVAPGYPDTYEDHIAA